MDLAAQDRLIKLACALIQRPSITPSDAGCQQLLAQQLQQAGFTIEQMKFAQVDNLFAYHNGSKKGQSLLFCGHTDVVPTGEELLWDFPPFAAKITENYLYGRGAADMKSAVAAFSLAMIDFVQHNPQHKGKVSVLLTSDEEGAAQDGIKKMMPHIASHHSFDYCVVGEPSSSEKLGDVVRIGRRGSLHVQITIHGKQGHVAYAENARNPVFLAAKFIDELSQHKWDGGNADFPPTSFQISSVKTSSATANIIPADLTLSANFRYAPVSTQESLASQLQALLQKHNLKYSLQWNLSGLPFHNTNKGFKQLVKHAITQVTGTKPVFNAAGGTSDGRFIAPFGVDVLELGVCNTTIHQINECVCVADVINLYKIYKQIITDLLG